MLVRSLSDAKPQIYTVVLIRLPAQSKIVHIPYQEAYGIGFEDMTRRKPDISKLKNLIDFEPTLEINEVVEKVIEYYRTI